MVSVYLMSLQSLNQFWTLVFTNKNVKISLFLIVLSREVLQTIMIDKGRGYVRVDLFCWPFDLLALDRENNNLCEAKACYILLRVFMYASAYAFFFSKEVSACWCPFSLLKSFFFWKYLICSFLSWRSGLTLFCQSGCLCPVCVCVCLPLLFLGMEVRHER